MFPSKKFYCIFMAFRNNHVIRCTFANMTSLHDSVSMLGPAKMKNNSGGRESDAINLPFVQVRMEWQVVCSVDRSCLPVVYSLERLLKLPGCGANYEKYIIIVCRPFLCWQSR